MRFKFLNSVLVSASMIAAAPAFAAPATSAAKLSVAGARVGATAKGEKLAGGAGIIALILVGGIVAIGVFAGIEGDGGDDNPQSN